MTSQILLEQLRQAIGKSGRISLKSGMFYHFSDLQFDSEFISFLDNRNQMISVSVEDIRRIEVEEQ